MAKKRTKQTKAKKCDLPEVQVADSTPDDVQHNDPEPKEGCPPVTSTPGSPEPAFTMNMSPHTPEYTFYGGFEALNRPTAPVTPSPSNQAPMALTYRAIAQPSPLSAYTNKLFPRRMPWTPLPPLSPPSPTLTPCVVRKRPRTDSLPSDGLKRLRLSTPSERSTTGSESGSTTTDSASDTTETASTPCTSIADDEEQPSHSKEDSGRASTPAESPEPNAQSDATPDDQSADASSGHGVESPPSESGNPDASVSSAEVEEAQVLDAGGDEGAIAEVEQPPAERFAELTLDAGLGEGNEADAQAATTTVGPPDQGQIQYPVPPQWMQGLALGPYPQGSLYIPGQLPPPPHMHQPPVDGQVTPQVDVSGEYQAEGPTIGYPQQPQAEDYVAQHYGGPAYAQGPQQFHQHYPPHPQQHLPPPDAQQQYMLNRLYQQQQQYPPQPQFQQQQYTPQPQYQQQVHPSHSQQILPPPHYQSVDAPYPASFTSNGNPPAIDPTGIPSGSDPALAMAPLPGVSTPQPVAGGSTQAPKFVFYNGGAASTSGTGSCSSSSTRKRKGRAPLPKKAYVPLPDVPAAAMYHLATPLADFEKAKIWCAHRKAEKEEDTDECNKIRTVRCSVLIERTQLAIQEHYIKEHEMILDAKDQKCNWTPSCPIRLKGKRLAEHIYKVHITGLKRMCESKGCTLDQAIGSDWCGGTCGRIRPVDENADV